MKIAVPFQRKKEKRLKRDHLDIYFLVSDLGSPVDASSACRSREPYHRGRALASDKFTPAAIKVAKSRGP